MLYVSSDPSRAYAVRRAKTDHGDHSVGQDATGKNDGGLGGSSKKVSEDVCGKLMVMLVWMTINTLLFIRLSSGRRKSLT